MNQSRNRSGALQRVQGFCCADRHWKLLPTRSNLQRPHGSRATAPGRSIVTANGSESSASTAITPRPSPVSREEPSNSTKTVGNICNTNTDLLLFCCQRRRSAGSSSTLLTNNPDAINWCFTWTDCHCQPDFHTDMHHGHCW